MAFFQPWLTVVGTRPQPVSHSANVIYGLRVITSSTKWWCENLFILYGALEQSQQFLMTFQDYPPRQKPDSFSIDQIAEKLMNYQNMQYK